jgi:hypothetical protein
VRHARERIACIEREKIDGHDRRRQATARELDISEGKRYETSSVAHKKSGVPFPGSARRHELPTSSLLNESCCESSPQRFSATLIR